LANTAAWFLAILVGPVTARAAPPNLEGGVDDYTRDLITSDCRGATNANLNAFLTFVSAGSGTPTSAMIQNLQGAPNALQVAGPMTRPFSAVHCSDAAAARAGAQASAQGLFLGFQPVVVVGNTADSASCGGGHATSPGTPGLRGGYAQLGPDYSALAVDG